MTTIDGNHTKGLSVVSFIDEEGFGSVLEGFTITNGYAPYGGGILCDVASSPTIRNNTIVGNVAESGGGIHCITQQQPAV